MEMRRIRRLWKARSKEIAKQEKRRSKEIAKKG